MGGLLAAGNARAQAPPFFSSTFMKLHIVPARTGMTWVKLGIRTFWKQPMALAALFFMTMASMSLASMIPLVGPAVAQLNERQLGLPAIPRDALPRHADCSSPR